jgi:Neuraminidase (sialidase)
MKKHNLNNSKVTTTVVVAFVIAAFATFSTTTTLIIQSAYAVQWTDPDPTPRTRSAQAPSVVTGDNIYIAWWNGTAGEPEVQTDVMFRASTDGGATFGDKINLSNTTDADSWRVEIAGEGETVVVSWWETNQTSDVSVARVSNDGGETFGPLLMLGTNGTIGSTEEEGEEGVEQAVEEAAAGEGGGG